MSARQIILLFCAILAAAVTAFAIHKRIQPQAAQHAPRAEVQVLVAKQDIPLGNFVRVGQDMDWAAWPVDAVQAYNIRKGSADVTSFNGAVARRSIHAGEAITASMLLKPGSGGFLSAVLEPGKRAVSIAVNAESGTAGLIFPGDHVDLIVTHKMKVHPAPNAPDQETVVSDTFVENARVVAVDQQLDNPENKAILAKTVTVEVTPEQAQRVAVAADIGKISFALRSIAADSQKKSAQGAGLPNADPLIPTSTDGAHFTSGGEVSRALDQNGPYHPHVMVIRGDVSEQREFIEDKQ